MTAGRIAGSAATVVAVTSGKGGVGKTNVAINLGVALADMGYQTGVLDADLGLGNVDVMLGLSPERHLGHVLAGGCRVADVVLPGPRGVHVVPSGSGLQTLTALTATQHGAFADALGELRSTLDILIVDTAPGASDNVVSLLLHADRVMLVTSLEPAALVDAYAMVKLASAAGPGTPVGIVINDVAGAGEAMYAFRQVDRAARRFLGRHLDYDGFINADPQLREAVLVQRSVVDHRPQAPASRCFRALATRLSRMRAQAVASALPTASAMEVRPCA